MPLAKRWFAFNKINIRRESNKYGVYELGNVDDTLYIGEGYVFARLMAHFADGSDPIPGASLYRVEYTGSKLRAQQRQNAELASYYRKHGRYPRFNQRKGRLRRRH